MIKQGNTRENIKEHNPNWSQIPWLTVIIGSSGSGITNVLLNVIRHPPDNDKM